MVPLTTGTASHWHRDEGASNSACPPTHVHALSTSRYVSRVHSLVVRVVALLLVRLGFSGFTHIFEWTDRPSAVYSAHTHSSVSAHYIFRGEMRVHYPELDRTITYKAGDRFDVPAKMVHAASIGQQGCAYMVGEK